MNSQLYLGLVGSEQLIKRFASKVQVPHAVIAELGRHASSNDEKSWKWRTARRSSFTNFPEDSVLPLLREHEIILHELNACRHEAHFSVTIICQFEENESACGFSFSRETIEVMGQFGASLEIDAVSIMAPAEL